MRLALVSLAGWVWGGVTMYLTGDWTIALAGAVLIGIAGRLPKPPRRRRRRRMVPVWIGS